MGKDVEYSKNEKKQRAYLAIPSSGSGPGLIVLQEWWGLVDHIKRLCDRFAEAGYCALAPDLYHGDTTTEPTQAQRMMMQLGVGEVERDLAAAIDFLIEQEACSSDKVAALGFCMGGQLALFAASKNPQKIAAVIDFYGIHPNIKPDFEHLTAAVLGIFAEKDEFVPPSAVKELAQTMASHGKSFNYKIFEGVDHAFFNDSRKDVYHPGSAAEAFQMSLSHLKQHLS